MVGEVSSARAFAFLDALQKGNASLNSLFLRRSNDAASVMQGLLHASLIAGHAHVTNL